MKFILVTFFALFLTACGGRGIFESYYEVQEQDDFQITIRAHCGAGNCPSIFKQANEVAKAHCRSNNKNYTLEESWETGRAAGWERMRYYQCL